MRTFTGTGSVTIVACRWFIRAHWFCLCWSLVTLPLLLVRLSTYTVHTRPLQSILSIVSTTFGLLLSSATKCISHNVRGAKNFTRQMLKLNSIGNCKKNCEKVIKRSGKTESVRQKSQVDKILIRHFAGRLLHAKRGSGCPQLPATERSRQARGSGREEGERECVLHADQPGGNKKFKTFTFRSGFVKDHVLNKYCPMKRTVGYAFHSLRFDLKSVLGLFTLL